MTKQSQRLWTSFPPQFTFCRVSYPDHYFRLTTVFVPIGKPVYTQYTNFGDSMVVSPPWCPVQSPLSRLITHFNGPLRSNLHIIGVFQNSKMVVTQSFNRTYLLPNMV